MFDSVCDIEHFSKKSTKWKKCHASQCFGCWSKHRSAVYWELRRGNFHYFVFVQKQARKCLILYAIYIKIYRFRGFSQKIDKVEKCHTSQWFGCWSKHRWAVYWELRRGNFHHFFWYGSWYSVGAWAKMKFPGEILGRVGLDQMGSVFIDKSTWSH